MNEAFGACQTIEWKEQEFLYLKSRVEGLGRRESYCAVSGGRTGTGSLLPPVHRALVRSVSTPDAPALETRARPSRQQGRRPSLNLEMRAGNTCGCGRWAGPDLPEEPDSYDLHEVSSQVRAKIVSYVKSAAWASRESLLSAASFSIATSDEDEVEEEEEGSVVRDGPARSVSEETLTYSLEPPACPAESDAPPRPASPVSPDTRLSFSSILDSIPHIDSSDDEREEREDKRDIMKEKDKEEEKESLQQEDTAAETITSDEGREPELPPLCLPEEDLCGEAADAAARRHAQGE